MKTVKLGTYVKTVTPNTKIQTKKFLKAGKYPIVSQESGIVNGYWDNAGDVMHFEKPVIVFGDHTRNIKFIDFDFVAGADGTKILQPPVDLDTKYLYYWMLANPIEGLGYARHFRLLKEMSMAVPSINEQLQTVKQLDAAFEKIDRAIKLTRENIQNIQMMEESATTQLLSASDKIKQGTIEDLSDVTTDYVANGSFASLKENVQYKDEEDYAILIRLIDNSRQFAGPFIYVDRPSYDFLKKSSLEPGDIIISNVGARLGTVFRAPDLGKKMTLGPNSILLKSKEHGDYIYVWLRSKAGQAAIKQLVGGAGQPKFNKTDFRKMVIPIPVNTDTQTQLVREIIHIESQASKLTDLYRHKLKTMGSLKQSLLTQAFSQYKVN